TEDTEKKIAPCAPCSPLVKIPPLVLFRLRICPDPISLIVPKAFTRRGAVILVVPADGIDYRLLSWFVMHGLAVDHVMRDCGHEFWRQGREFLRVIAVLT